MTVPKKVGRLAKLIDKFYECEFYVSHFRPHKCPYYDETGNCDRFSTKCPKVNK